MKGDRRCRKELSTGAVGEPKRCLRECEKKREQQGVGPLGIASAKSNTFSLLTVQEDRPGTELTFQRETCRATKGNPESGGDK